MKRLLPLLLLALLAGSFPADANPLRIVVLPFDKLNKEKDSDLETLTSGISETLAGALSNVQNFIIIDSARVKRYLLDNEEFNQAIGVDSGKNMDNLRKLARDKLEGDYIIYGSFHRIAKQINLNARFLKINDGTIVKAAAVHGEYPDRIFDLQEDLAKKLIGAINGRVESAQDRKITDYITSTEDYTAYQYYIKGRMEHIKYSTADYPRALELYQMAVDKDPNFALAWSGMSEVNALWGYQILYAGGNFKEKLDTAIRQGQKAVELGPNLYQTHRALSVAYLNSSDFENSRRAIEPAYRLNPADPEILWVKASLVNYGFKGMGTPGSEANNYILKALEINPDLIVARWALAHSLSTLNRLDESLAEYNKILRINQSHSQSLHAVALIYYNKNDYRNSVRYALQAVNADPEVPQHHYTLGLGYYQLKEWSGSESALKQAISRKADYTDAIFTLAGTYYNRAMYREARDTYADVLRYNPNYPGAAQWRDNSAQKMQGGGG